MIDPSRRFQSRKSNILRELPGFFGAYVDSHFLNPKKATSTEPLPIVGKHWPVMEPVYKVSLNARWSNPIWNLRSELLLKKSSVVEGCGFSFLVLEIRNYYFHPEDCQLVIGISIDLSCWHVSRKQTHRDRNVLRFLISHIQRF